MSHIDIEQLLSPISDESPCGEQLSEYDGELRDILDAWNEARGLIEEEKAKEHSGGIDAMGQPWRTIPAPDWQPVLDLSTAVIEQKSKDLRVAAWLAEALMRVHGFSGLHDGLKLCLEMCRRYWDGVLPRPTDDEGHQDTVNGIRSLCSETGAQGVLGSILVQGQAEGTREVKRYSVLDYLRAKELDKIDADERRRRIDEEGQPEQAQIQEVARITPDELMKGNLGAIDGCLSTLRELDEFLRENCQPDEYDEETFPSVEALREQLAESRKVVCEFTSDTADEPEDSDEGEVAISEGVASAAQKSAMTREKAFVQIEEIARFFEKTEPHSPISFALRQAVRWGRAPLPELLGELIDDESVMDSLQRLIGLPQPSSDDDD